MIIDVAIVLIVLLFIFLGFKNGFIHTVLHTFGWIIAIVIAALLRKPFGNLIEKHTTIYGHIYSKTETLLQSLASHNGTSGIPGALSDDMQSAADKATTAATEQISNVLFTIIVFLILLILIKLVFFIITLILSKRHRKRGIVGGFDGLAGALFGLAQAALLVFALLAVMLPVSFLINPSAYDWVVHQMDRSVFSQYLYENNPLLTVVKEYIPHDILPAEWFSK